MKREREGGADAREGAPPPVPLLPGAWRALPLADAREVLALADVAWPVGWTAGPITRVFPLLALQALPMGFLPGCVLLQFDLLLRAGLRGTADAVWGPGWFQWLTGSVRWLPGQPDSVPGLALRLDSADRVADYLRFFCGCLWLQQGQHTVRIVDSAHAPALHGAPPGAWRRQVRRCRAVPASTGGHQVNCTLLHAGHLERAVYLVAADGRVQLLQSELLATDLLPAEALRPPLRSLVALPGELA